MSPWAYLGSQRFYALKKKYNFKIIHNPLDHRKLFSITGGVPLAKRSKQRKEYRIMELERWKEILETPLNINPKYFPPSDIIIPSCMILALENEESQNHLAQKFLEYVWVKDKDLGNKLHIIEACKECNLEAEELFNSYIKFVEKFESLAEKAADINVFGSPSYVIDSEVFWGQDRLELLERKLKKGNKN